LITFDVVGLDRDRYRSFKHPCSYGDDDEVTAFVVAMVATAGDGVVADDDDDVDAAGVAGVGVCVVDGDDFVLHVSAKCDRLPHRPHRASVIE
jgi:hypothetical protein